MHKVYWLHYLATRNEIPMKRLYMKRKEVNKNIQKISFFIILFHAVVNDLSYFCDQDANDVLLPITIDVFIFMVN